MDEKNSRTLNIKNSNYCLSKCLKPVRIKKINNHFMLFYIFIFIVLHSVNCAPKSTKISVQKIPINRFFKANKSSSSIVFQQNSTQPKEQCSPSREFQCLNSNLGAVLQTKSTTAKCIKLSQVCDSIADCGDKSDEKNCDFCNRTIVVNNEKNVVQRMLIQTPNSLKNRTLDAFSCFYK
jgi:hypothetical protein